MDHVRSDGDGARTFGDLLTAEAKKETDARRLEAINRLALRWLQNRAERWDAACSSPYIVAAAIRNEIRSAMRSERGHSLAVEGASADEFGAESRIETAFDAQRMLERIMRKVSPDAAAVLALVADGCTDKEIADETRRTPAASRKAVQRARESASAVLRAA